MNKTLFAFGLVCALPAVGGDPVLSPAPNPTSAIAEAEAAAKKTSAVGFLWRDTEKLITEAKKALTSSDPGSALTLAQRAKSQAERGYEQYERSQKH